MSRWRKKPVEVEAVRWAGDNWSEVYDWIMKHGPDMQDPGIHRRGHEITISTLEGEMTASVGDWIIKGVKGEFYPCKPDVFETSYEEVIG